MSELPKGWATSSLSQLVLKLVDGSHSPPPKQPEGLPMLSARNISDGRILFDEFRLIKQEDFEREDKRTSARPSDVLLTIVGAIGRSAIIPICTQRFTLQRSVAVVRPLDGIDPQYLKYAFDAPEFQRWMVDNAKGTAQKGVYLNKLAGAFIPVAPADEQRRIVAKLDNLFARSRRAREELERIPKLCDRYKQAVVAAACSGRLTADWRQENNFSASSILRLTINEPYKHDFFAPEHWKKYDLVQVCKLIGGSQPPKSMFSYTPKPGYLRLIQIRDYKSDNFITYVPKESARRFCSVDDVMVGRYGPPIFQILRGIEGAYNVALMKAEPCLEIASKEFIYYYLQHPNLFNYVDISSDRTAGQSGVNKAHLEKYPVFVPPLEEQTVIVQRVEKLFKAIDLMEQEYQKASKLCGRLEQATLSKAFRGELVPQDPNDEPAAVLLERLRAENPIQTKGKGIKSKQRSRGQS